MRSYPKSNKRSLLYVPISRDYGAYPAFRGLSPWAAHGTVKASHKAAEGYGRRPKDNPVLPCKGVTTDYREPSVTDDQGERRRGCGRHRRSLRGSSRAGRMGCVRSAGLFPWAADHGPWLAFALSTQVLIDSGQSLHLRARETSLMGLRVPRAVFIGLYAFPLHELSYGAPEGGC